MGIDYTTYIYFLEKLGKKIDYRKRLLIALRKWARLENDCREEEISRIENEYLKGKSVEELEEIGREEKRYRKLMYGESSRLKCLKGVKKSSESEKQKERKNSAMDSEIEKLQKENEKLKEALRSRDWDLAETEAVLMSVEARLEKIQKECEEK